MAEMYNFLGIMLKISLTSLNFGGYKAYFTVGNHTAIIHGGEYKFDLAATGGWASQYMSLHCFKEI